MAEASQSQKCLTLDERNRSPSMTDSGLANCSQPGKSVTENTSLYPSPRFSKIPSELMTIEKVVGQTQKTGLEIAEASQSQQYMALDERNRSPSMTDAGRATCPQPGQSVTEYASLYSSPRCWEIPAEFVTIEKVVGEGAFSQVARATVIGLQGRPKKTLVVVKMLKGIKYFK